MTDKNDPNFNVNQIRGEVLEKLDDGVDSAVLNLVFAGFLHPEVGGVTQYALVLSEVLSARYGASVRGKGFEHNLLSKSATQYLAIADLLLGSDKKIPTISADILAGTNNAIDQAHDRNIVTLSSAMLGFAQVMDRRKRDPNARLDGDDYEVRLNRILREGANLPEEFGNRAKFFTTSVLGPMGQARLSDAGFQDIGRVIRMPRANGRTLLDYYGWLADQFSTIDENSFSSRIMRGFVHGLDELAVGKEKYGKDQSDLQR